MHFPEDQPHGKLPFGSCLRLSVEDISVNDLVSTVVYEKVVHVTEFPENTAGSENYLGFEMIFDKPVSIHCV